MTLSIKVLVVIALCLIVPAYSVWSHYIDTLTLSEIIGASGNEIADIALSFLNFDTGCTRHEISEFIERSQAWIQQIQEIKQIPDASERQSRQTALTAEMMRGPVFKKLARPFLKIGIRSTDSILGFVSIH